ncbi:hypothetical protein ACWXVL_02850 [Mycoplasma sp. 128]|uniref:hypothetical protein n=1 Tax=Mycoplasma sp. 3341 TaxID=3447506 RepID=UPI003F656AEF
MNNFKEISDTNAAKIQVGSLITVLTTLIPLGINLISSLIGIGKMATSQSGEIKTKDVTYKWTNEAAKENYVFPVHYNI